MNYKPTLFLDDQLGRTSDILLNAPKETGLLLANCFSTKLCFSILFQRGIYPYESFSKKTAYGLPVFMTDDMELAAFISKFMEQLKGLLLYFVSLFCTTN